jgi:hypothetical protein
MKTMFPRDKNGPCFLVDWNILPAQIIKLCYVNLNYSNLKLMIYVLDIDKLSGDLKGTVWETSDLSIKLFESWHKLKLIKGRKKGLPQHNE